MIKITELNSIIKKNPLGTTFHRFQKLTKLAIITPATEIKLVLKQIKHMRQQDPFHSESESATACNLQEGPAL
ncbi:MAG: hypothetical protein U5N10_00890 [Gemmobacter sp.]|nr:hypothetical protein [Gemmobacter sp.]